jgi:hypothetical protein
MFYFQDVLRLAVNMFNGDHVGDRKGEVVCPWVGKQASEGAGGVSHTNIL